MQVIWAARSNLVVADAALLQRASRRSARAWNRSGF